MHVFRALYCFKQRKVWQDVRGRKNLCTIDKKTLAFDKGLLYNLHVAHFMVRKTQACSLKAEVLRRRCGRLPEKNAFRVISADCESNYIRTASLAAQQVPRIIKSDTHG